MRNNRMKAVLVIFCMITTLALTVELFQVSAAEAGGGALENDTSTTFLVEEDDDPEANLSRTDAIEKASASMLLGKSSGVTIQSASGTTTTSSSDTSSDEEEFSVKAYGIDVSKYQGEIDWTKVKEAGVSFAIIRVGYRGYSAGAIVQDDYAIENIEGALKTGIEVGVYFFSTALNEEEAIEEAQFVLKAIENYDITYPVVYDCEGYDNTSYRNYGLSSEVRTQNAVAFLNYVESAGYQGMMYGSKNALQNDASWDSSTLEQYYDIWVAQYYYYTSGTQYPNFSTLVSSGRMTSYTGTYRMWQFTSQGTVDGISGYVDLDIEYGIVADSDEEDDDATDTDATETDANLNGWVTDDDGNVYYYEEGVVQTGFYEVDGYRYYFNESGIMQTGLYTINDKLYYFTYKGVMWTGLVTVDNGNGETATYYFGTDGAAVTDGWRTVDDNRYYFTESGEAATGWFLADEAYYFFDNTTGVMQTGWTMIDSNTYYFSKLTATKGQMITGWATIGGSRYYFSKLSATKGQMITGWASIGGSRYYFSKLSDTEGQMITGWASIGGSRYYFSKLSDTKGQMITGWASIGGSRYYFSKLSATKGQMITGWAKIEGSTYYFSKLSATKGQMITGWAKIQGKNYYFYSNGKLKQ